jgi:cytochrome c oxidase subunit III
MTYTLLFLAVLMAVFVGWLVRQSVNVTPWVANSHGGAALYQAPDWFTGPRVGLVVFMAVMTSVFGLTVSAYMMRMAATDDWQFLPQPPLSGFNYGLLVMASVALHATWMATRRDDPRYFWGGLALAAGFSAAFMLGQFLMWRDLVGAGYYASAFVGSAFFALMSALHGLHLLGGLLAVWRIVLQLRRGARLADIRESIGLCVVYWHFLLLVWTGLFVVLFVGAEPLYAFCRSSL